MAAAIWEMADGFLLGAMEIDDLQIKYVLHETFISHRRRQAVTDDLPMPDFS